MELLFPRCVFSPSLSLSFCFFPVLPQTHSHADDQLVCDTQMRSLSPPPLSFFWGSLAAPGETFLGQMFLASVPGTFFLLLFFIFFFLQLNKEPKSFPEHTSPALSDLPALFLPHVPDSWRFLGFLSTRNIPNRFFAKKFHLTAAFRSALC